MAQKMLVGDTDTVIVIPATEVAGIPNGLYPTGLQPITTITSALLNYYLTANTPAAAASKWGGNITCAILADWKLEMKDSTVKVLKTLCSVGQAGELTFYNYEGVLNLLRDINPLDATSEFNVPANLFNGPDVPYIIGHRIGFSRTVAAAAGQEWNFYYFWTDINIPAFLDGEYQQIGETLIPKGVLNFKSVLAS